MIVCGSRTSLKFGHLLSPFFPSPSLHHYKFPQLSESCAASLSKSTQASLALRGACTFAARSRPVCPRAPTAHDWPGRPPHSPPPLHHLRRGGTAVTGGTGWVSGKSMICTVLLCTQGEQASNAGLDSAMEPVRLRSSGSCSPLGLRQKLYPTEFSSKQKDG